MGKKKMGRERRKIYSYQVPSAVLKHTDASALGPWQPSEGSTKTFPMDKVSDNWGKFPSVTQQMST